MELQNRAKNNMQSRIFFLIILEWSISICLFLFLQNSKIPQLILLSQCALGLLVFLMLAKKLPVRYLFYCASCFAAFVNAYINGSGFGSALCYISLMTMIVLGTVVVFRKKQIKILNIYCLVTVFAVLVFFSSKEGVMYKAIFGSSVLVNPNCYATLLFAAGALSFVVITQCVHDKYFNFILRIITFMIFLWAIYKTGARTSMLCWLLFNAGVILSKTWLFANRKIANKLIFFTICACLAVTVAYVLIYKSIGENFMILGKNFFTGRENIWSEVFDRLKNHWLFGFSNEIALAGGAYNTHNGFLSIFGNLGIIPFLAFIYYLSTSIVIKDRNSKVKINRYKLVAILSFMVLTTFESFIMDANYYFLLLPFLFNKEKESEYDTASNKLLLVRKRQEAKSS